MNFICSEIENIYISIKYYSYIKELFEDYIKYISNYRLITIEYIKKLTQFHEKYNSKLSGGELDLFKFKNINTAHIDSIISPIPKLVKKQIENLNILMFGIESQINNYDLIIKEKDILFSKFQKIFEESRKDLLQKYKDIDKLKDEFMNSMSNTEDIVNKYLNRKDQTTFEQIKNSILESKQVEKNYKNGIKSAKYYEENFESMYQNSIVNVKKIICDISSKMKDTITDFLILLKNYYKMQSSEIDLYLPELSELNEEKELEKIIDNSFNTKNKLLSIEPEKYKLKIFENKNNSDDDILNTNPIYNLEDGFEEMPTIKDEIILYIFKTMKENFELIYDNNMNLKAEEEKMRCLNLTERILSLENINENKDNEPTKKDLEELNKLLDIHDNRVVFLQKLSEYRIKGKYQIKKKTFEILSNLFKTVINTIERDKDLHSVKNAIIISQTYYIKNENNKKEYLFNNIKNNIIFKSKKFWEEFVEYSISKEIVTSVNNDVKNGTLLTTNNKESEAKKSNIAFGQIISYVDNMIEFGLDKEFIQEIIFPIITKYKINKESIETIKSVLNNK